MNTAKLNKKMQLFSEIIHLPLFSSSFSFFHFLISSFSFFDALTTSKSTCPTSVHRRAPCRLTDVPHVGLEVVSASHKGLCLSTHRISSPNSLSSFSSPNNSFTYLQANSLLDNRLTSSNHSSDGNNSPATPICLYRCLVARLHPHGPANLVPSHTRAKSAKSASICWMRFGGTYWRTWAASAISLEQLNKEGMLITSLFADKSNEKRAFLHISPLLFSQMNLFLTRNAYICTHKATCHFHTNTDSYP